ncbi:helix-turn-helix transcriptional regulator [Undibacterium sp.]|uniref:helix-turn-helix transcriptional regulator n=1 Tax=Undibacterium sp. TaxID=1914977 RepID=UPI003752C4C3
MISKNVKKIKLTASELECLKWVIVGKFSWEISRILSRSAATVNSILRISCENSIYKLASKR